VPISVTPKAAVQTTSIIIQVYKLIFIKIIRSFFKYRSRDYNSMNSATKERSTDNYIAVNKG
jgi:hypothetical protein